MADNSPYTIDAPDGWTVIQNPDNQDVGVETNVTIDDDGHVVGDEAAFLADAADIGLELSANRLVRALTPSPGSGSEVDPTDFVNAVAQNQVMIDATEAYSRTLVENGLATLGANADRGDITSLLTTFGAAQRTAYDSILAEFQSNSALEDSFPSDGINSGSWKFTTSPYLTKWMLAYTVRLEQIAGSDQISVQAVGEAATSASDANRAVILGGYRDDTITGSLFDDVLAGGGGDDVLDGRDGDDILAGGSGADQIHGGSGFDTVSYADHSKGTSASLNADGTGTGGNEFNGTGGDTFTSIEALEGSQFADQLTTALAGSALRGLGGDDRLMVNATDAIIDGGDGVDTVVYSGNAGVMVDLAFDAEFGGDSAGNALIDIENVSGSNGDDVIYGDGGENRLIGNAGDDILEGGAGADVLIGYSSATQADEPGAVNIASYSRSSAGVVVSLLTGTGSAGDAEGDRLYQIDGLIGSAHNDRLSGNNAANTIAGGEGDDIIQGWGGADEIDGGLGNDTASYAGSTGAVAIDLGLGTASGGHAEGDVLFSIENLIGSVYGDQLNGTFGTDNILSGENGDDMLRGRGGADHLDGGAGFDIALFDDASNSVVVNLELGVAWRDSQRSTLVSIEGVVGGSASDTLIGNDADNTFEGLAGADNISGLGGYDVVSYAASDAGVTVSLLSGTGSGGHAQGDYLTGIEGLIGSDFDDVFAGNADANRLVGGDGNDVLRGRGGADRLIGGNGVDRITYSDSNAAVIISLLAGTASGGHAQGDVFSGIEEVEGSAYADRLAGDSAANTLIGGAGDDFLRGRGGADRLEGGDGFDTASYDDSSAGVIVSLLANAGYAGDANGDMLLGIEALEGSAFDDRLAGDAAANTLIGGAGDDFLRGRGGADRLEGGNGFDTASYDDSSAGVIVSLLANAGYAGHANGDVLLGIEGLEGSAFNDRLAGDAAANTLIGGAGDDFLRGRGGADRLEGGEGIDTASYDDSSAGVTVNLLTGTGTGGDAQGDTLSGIENLTGSAFADTLTGNAAANILIGDTGDDVLQGGAGADQLDGGNGSDTLSYAGSDAGVTVSLLTGLSFGGHAAGDTFSSIENLTGSGHSDTLSGDNGDNTLRGLDGSDLLRGRAGADILEGGTGADRFVYGVASDSGTTAATRDTILDFSRAQGDRIDLSEIDTDPSTVGDQAFTFLGSSAFTGAAGQVRAEIDSGNTFVYADINGDGVADMSIRLIGSVSLSSGDFLL